MTERENWLRAVEFRSPEWIPFQVSLGPAVYHKYREELEKLILRHPLIFKGYKKGSINFDNFPPGYRKGEYTQDSWGCLWYSAEDGILGQVVEHPLSDYRALDTYQPPNPLKKYNSPGPIAEERNWDEAKRNIEQCKKNGFLAENKNWEELFTRLYYLRGFENLMVDIATDAPQLPRLIKMLLDYETKVVDKWIEIGVDVLNFHTDIGTQKGLMINPIKFRKYIKPMFKQIFRKCRDVGVHVYLSSDGCLLEIVDDLIECGVSVHDPQFRANTLDGIAKAYKGKLCAMVDLDRQMFLSCTPEDIKKQVKEVVKRLDSPKGGLMIWAVLWEKEIPLENIEAACEAMEEYCLKGK